MPQDDLYKTFQLFVSSDDPKKKIEAKHLKRIARELGENLTEEDAIEIINEADHKSEGKISKEDFISVMQKTNLF